MLTEKDSRPPQARPHVAILTVGLASVVFLALSSRGDEDQPRAVRTYDQGPLTPDDFRAPPQSRATTPEGGPLLAYTWTECRYSYKVRSERAGQRIRARLVEVTFVAIVDPERSWNSVKQNLRVLDHEQGHFDISQGLALELQLAYEKKLREGWAPVATAATYAIAQSNLEAEFKKLVDPILDQFESLQKQYDRETRSGTNPAKQAEHRRQQTEKIERLQAEFEALRAK